MLAKNKQSVIKLQKLDLLIYKADAAKILIQSTNLIDSPSIKIWGSAASYIMRNKRLKILY